MHNILYFIYTFFTSPCFLFHFVPIFFPNLFSWCDRYYDIVRDVRQNKGSILKASVDYIRKLKVDQQKKRLLEDRVRIQEIQNRKLVVKLQVSELRIHKLWKGFSKVSN